MTQTARAFLEYSDNDHRYFSDGRERMSVTQVLDAAGLISPFCKDEEARFRGSKVHEFVAIDDVTPLDLRKVPGSLRGYIRAWRKFRTDTGFMPTLIEHRVDDPVNNFSGRFDRLGIRAGQKLLTLLDIKTSKTGAIADYPRLQTAAYALAHDPKKIFERMTVSLMPNGRYNSLTYPLFNHHADRSEWLGILRQVKENNSGRND